jgi:lipoic acid synthetase
VNQETHNPRLPDWLRLPRRVNDRFEPTSGIIVSGGLNTVCRESRCPNRYECWDSGCAAFLILGTICTRRCRFCAAKYGRPEEPDPGEPVRLASAAAEMGLRHVVITSVTRDDLPDQGAGHFAAVIRAVKAGVPGAQVEVLTPDFWGRPDLIRTVIEAGPDVYAHNLETVERLAPVVRPRAGYRRSLAVFDAVRSIDGGMVAKSGLLLGLGETDAEADQAMRDLRSAGVGLLTVGQYLQPTYASVPVDRYVTPEEFERWRKRGLELGFLHVAASPLTRSSRRAAELLRAPGAPAKLAPRANKSSPIRVATVPR